MTDQRFCPNCGTTVSTNERFCGNCGSRMPETSAAPSDANPMPVSRQAAPPTQVLRPEQADAPTQILPPARRRKSRH
ncbi:MAG: zinc ribbon domain-containing protein [Oscillochloris sp.]|nr:zinc ribbon domain-containing protein [Oscillochloris sp.]